MKYFVTIFIFTFLQQEIDAQNAVKNIIEGNTFYQQKNWLAAQIAYEKALEKDATNTTALFNYANVLHQQKQHTKAVSVLDDVIQLSQKDAALQAKAYYNKGLMAIEQKQIEQAIQAFKQSLKLNNTDEQTRENLQKALLEQKKQQPKNSPPKPNEQPKNNPKEKPLNKQEAERQLQMLREEEKRLQKDIQNRKYSPIKNQKDW